MKHETGSGGVTLKRQNLNTFYLSRFKPVTENRLKPDTRSKVKRLQIDETGGCLCPVRVALWYPTRVLLNDTPVGSRGCDASRGLGIWLGGVVYGVACGALSCWHAVFACVNMSGAYVVHNTYQVRANHDTNLDLHGATSYLLL